MAKGRYLLRDPVESPRGKPATRGAPGTSPALRRYRNTPAVVNEHSSEHIHATIDESSSVLAMRPISVCSIIESISFLRKGLDHVGADRGRGDAIDDAQKYQRTSEYSVEFFSASPYTVLSDPLKYSYPAMSLMLSVHK